MKISKTDYEQFRNWCQQFFKNNREVTSRKLVEKLKTSRPMLFNTIEKVVGKGKGAAYIGRFLLTSVRKYGWLTYEKNTWRTKPNWGLCTYCFQELEDVYVIDIDGNQYCDSDCFDDYEATEYCDSYYDEYLFLCSDFKDLKERYSIFLLQKLEPKFEYHLELSGILAEISELLTDTEYTTVWMNGGDDGPLAYEIFRMLSILQEDQEELEKVEARFRNERPKDNQMYSIKIDSYFLKKRQKPEVLRQFVKQYRKYRSKELSNKWTTFYASLRSQWYDLLEKVPFEYVNEIKCPACEEISDGRWQRRLMDGFYYCSDCAVEYKNFS